MSKSFKKVVACLLAVLMVMFSVPFSAFAAGSDYTPDVRLQFNALSESAGDAGSWVSNVSEGSINQKGKNTVADFSQGGLSAPQLKATGKVSADAKYSVSALTLEAADVANYLDARAEDEEFETEKENIDDDYALQAGDTFTVTIRMDGVPTVYTAATEIAYSDNIEPVYVVENGKMSSSTRTVKFGTAAQVGEQDETPAMSDYDAAALYDGINTDGTASAVKTDYDGQNYMYAEVVGTGTTDWSAVTAEEPPVLTNEDGTVGNTFASQSVMATYMFVLKSTPSADNPIEFWVHNGNTGGYSKDEEGNSGFSSFLEGYYEADNADNLATCATYVENRFAGPKAQFGAETPNPGSFKMTFMGKNENVQSAECAHEHTTTTVTNTATCTEAGVKTTKVVCDDCNETISETTENVGALGHDYVAGTTVAPTCTEKGYTPYTCSRCSDTYNGDYVDATGHKYKATAIAWDSDDAVTATVTLVCENDSTHTDTANATVNSVEKSAATCTADQVMTYTASYEGIDSISKDVTVAETATGHNYTTVYTAPTCTENGYTTYTCTAGDDEYVAYDDPDTTKGHAYELTSIDWDTLDTTTGKVTGNYVCANDDTHTTTGELQTTFEVIQQQTEDDPEITRYTYAVGEIDEHKDVQTKAPAGHTTHNYTVPVSIAWDGDDAVTATVTLKCAKCDATTTTTATVNSVEKSAATCTADQVMTYTASYEGLDSISKDVTVADTATGHKWTAVDITWDGDDAVTATANYVCSNDANHTDTAVADVKKELKSAATVTEPAVYTYTASYDGFESISKDVKEGEALGVNITIPKYAIGQITFNGEEVDGTKENTFNVAYGAEYTIAVTEDAEYFDGWIMNGKAASKDASYTTYAYTDITVTPTFVDPTASSITVVFYDMYGNTVKAYRDMSAEAYQAAILADGIPTAASYPNQKFTGWDTDDNEILGLTESKTIWAVYEKVESVKKFNVTVNDAAGADITAATLELPDGMTSDAVPYNTKVTVYNENAKGWSIDGVTVSTDNTYSFFVGADVTVTMIVADVEAVPSTTIIGANLINTYDYARYNILATRVVPEGYTLVDYGFVYGKNLNDADMKVENEGKPGTGTNSGAVKVVRGGSSYSSNEFSLNYGIKTANNWICVCSFVTVKKGDKVETIYSAVERYTSTLA